MGNEEYPDGRTAEHAGTAEKTQSPNAASGHRICPMTPCLSFSASSGVKARLSWTLQLGMAARERITVSRCGKTAANPTSCSSLRSRSSSSPRSPVGTQGAHGGACLFGRLRAGSDEVEWARARAGRSGVQPLAGRTRSWPREPRPPDLGGPLRPFPGRCKSRCREPLNALGPTLAPSWLPLASNAGTGHHLWVSFTVPRRRVVFEEHAGLADD